MTSDLVERLRHCSENCGDEYLHELAGKAADRIAQLEAALRMIRDREPRGLSWSVHVARAALGEDRT